MLRQFSTRRIIGFVMFDWLGTLCTLLLASYLRTWLGTAPESLVTFSRALGIPIREWAVSTPTDALTWQVFILVSLLWPFFFVVFHVYDGRYNETLRSELLNVFMALLASTLALAGLLYFTYQETSRILFVMFFFLNILLLLGIRITWWSIRQHVGSKSSTQHTVLIIGAGEVGRRAVGELTKYAKGRVRVVGFVDDDLNKQNTQIAGFPVLGALCEIPTVIQAYEVHDALVALPLRAHDRLIDICHTLHDLSVRVHVIPDLFSLSFPSATLDGFGGIPVIDLGQPGSYGWRRWLKRMFDVIATIVIMLIAWPVMLVIALLIKLDSHGPVFYCQKRIGENGQPFYILKFRSMRVDADDRLHREHMARLIKENISLTHVSDNSSHSLKMQSDPRVTRIGRFIRKTSLDELPQFLNVLRGEMSLVGPRPPVPYEVEMYQAWHKRRLEAIPGVTGLWQVQGRNRVSFDEMVRMDIDYIENQSIWLDMKLVFLTPFALLSGRGAG